ncbi:MAG TPA: hypothetical protein VK280_11675 [Streptosporangiaceae bacterium]|nr:hypothetical protein [Streptosporangiaceae bacterium]
MRTESALAPDVIAASARSRRRRGDAVAVAVVVTLPAVIFGLPALLGHAVLPGDDLTQNLPLRVLAGQQILAGHLPLFNPYIWSGAPLLAGWNAAAAYPLTWLFAILPGTAAWTVNMIATWAVAGLGMFCFLRALRLASLASLLGAFSFAFAGGMSAQVTHFGLVAGMSWVPLALLSILRLSQDSPMALRPGWPAGAGREAGRGWPGGRSGRVGRESIAGLARPGRCGWTAVLAAAIGLVILAGEPRAIDDACVIVLLYGAWQVARLGRRAGPAVVSVSAGLALGVCLGAVQWLPGLTAISSSQRGADSMALYSSGSLPVRWVLLTLVPDLLGGSGSLGQPSFFGFYNLTEVTSYVGILPLVAAFALLGRLRWRPRPPDWLVWHIMALAGLALALGGNTPLGDLLYHLPLFGDQRLQSRNILVLDLALAVLLAYWADQPFRVVGASGGERGRRLTRETVLGLVPPLAAVAAVALAFTWGVGWIRWVGLDAGPSASTVARLKPWLLPYAVLGAAAAALVFFGRRLPPRLSSRLIAGFVMLDVLVFTIGCVVEIAPGVPSGGSATPVAAAAASPTAAAGQITTAAVMASARLRPVAALGYPGRFAIYDPDLLDPGDLSALDPPDNNASGDGAMPSVQGYSSTVDGRYASVTGSHQATGAGQDTLAPAAVADGTLDQLDTTVLLTPAAYLVSQAGGNGPAAGPADTGRRDIAADQRVVWYLGSTSEVSLVEVPDAEASRDVAAGIQIGLAAPDGSTRWFPARALTPRALAIAVPHPVASVAVAVQAPGRPAGPPGNQGMPRSLGPPSVTVAGGSVLVADGQLQDALVPPHWEFAGFDGPFAVFANRFAQPPLRIEALAGRPLSGAWLRGSGGAPAEPAAATVYSPHGARVVRSVAAIDGWSATWQPRHGPAVALTVQVDGLVQAVDVPPGLGVVTWSYSPPGFRAGLALSLAAAALAAAALAAAALVAACFDLAFRARVHRAPRGAV